MKAPIATRAVATIATTITPAPSARPSRPRSSSRAGASSGPQVTPGSDEADEKGRRGDDRIEELGHGAA